MRTLWVHTAGTDSTLGAPFEPGVPMSDSRTQRRPRSWYVRGVVGLVGELLVTLGVVLALFVGWQVLWTDVVADREQSAAVSALEDRFSVPSDGPSVPDSTIPPAELGDAFAVVRIPRFGADYARPLYEGTDRFTLQRGIGHYATTARPGEVGNFAIAGHRTTYGKPFSRIAELRVGDRVIVETAESYFVYLVFDALVVLPSQVEVVLPVPGEPGAATSERLLTMTSCHPQFSSRQRWVTHARLERTLDRSAGLPEELLEVTG